MSCPPDIAEVVVKILTAGILRIRAQGWSGDGQRCAVEADHLHNLPHLLSTYSPDLLRYYWEVERPSFIQHSSKADLALFEPLWQDLGSVLPANPRG
jgi:hypothetical protein